MAAPRVLGVLATDITVFPKLLCPPRRRQPAKWFTTNNIPNRQTVFFPQTPDRQDSHPWRWREDLSQCFRSASKKPRPRPFLRPPKTASFPRGFVPTSRACNFAPALMAANPDMCANNMAQHLAQLPFLKLTAKAWKRKCLETTIFRGELLVSGSVFVFFHIPTRPTYVPRRSNRLQYDENDESVWPVSSPLFQ